MIAQDVLPQLIRVHTPTLHFHLFVSPLQFSLLCLISQLDRHLT